MDGLHTLDSHDLSLAFDGQSGKWISLTSRRTNRNWLWSNPHLTADPLGKLDYAASYVRDFERAMAPPPNLGDAVFEDDLDAVHQEDMRHLVELAERGLATVNTPLNDPKE